MPTKEEIGKYLEKFISYRDGFPTEHLLDLLNEYAQAYESEVFAKSMVEDQNLETNDLFRGGMVAGWNMCKATILSRHEEAIKK